MFPFFYDEFTTSDNRRYRVLLNPVVPEWTEEQEQAARLFTFFGWVVILFLFGCDVMIVFLAMR